MNFSNEDLSFSCDSASTMCFGRLFQIPDLSPLYLSFMTRLRTILRGTGPFWRPQTFIVDSEIPICNSLAVLFLRILLVMYRITRASNWETNHWLFLSRRLSKLKSSGEEKQSCFSLSEVLKDLCGKEAVKQSL